MKAPNSQLFAGPVKVENGSNIVNGDLNIYYIASSSDQEAANASFPARLPRPEHSGGGVERVISKMKELFSANAVGEDVQLALGGDETFVELPSLWNQDDLFRVGIEGDAGAGKTTLFQKLAHDWATRAFVWHKKFDVVVLARLRLLSREEFRNQTMEEVMLQCVFRGDNSWANDVRAFLRWCKTDEARVLWLLDGWDEIDVNCELQAIKEGLKSDYVKYMIGSGRRGSIGRKGLQCQKVLRLHGLDKAGIDRFIQTRFLEDTDAANNVRKIIEGADWIKEACKKPLLLNFVCMVGADEIQNQAELFGQVVDLFIRQFVDKLHNIDRKQMHNKLRTLLRRLAFSSFQMKATEVAASSLESDHLERCGLLIPVTWKYGEVCSFEWMHKSVQEFLAAEYVCWEEEPVCVPWGKRLNRGDGEMLFRFLCELGKRAADRFDFWFPRDLDEKRLVKFLDGCDEVMRKQFCRFRPEMIQVPLVMEAAKHGLINALQFFFSDRKIPLNIDVDGHTPLFIACAYGRIQAVNWLLQKGANPGYISKSTNRNLLHSLSRDSHWYPEKERNCDLPGVIDLVFPLVLQGVHDRMGRQKLTPLHTACDSGYLQLVRLLLQQDCDVNVQQRDGRTPLFRACKRGHLDVVEVLLSCQGIQVDLADKNGQTPLHEVCRWENMRVFGRREDTSIQIAKSLISKNANVNATDKLGRTPLHFACEYSTNLARYLIEDAGASCDLVTKSGATVLHHLCRGGRCVDFSLAQMILVRNKNALSAVDSNGMTPIAYAVWKGCCFALIEFLWNCGLEKSKVDRNYFTIVAYVCIQSKNEHMIGKLENATQTLQSVNDLGSESKSKIVSWLQKAQEEKQRKWEEK